jgi:predicted transcriptional regulator
MELSKLDKQLISLLKKDGECSTSKIGFSLNINYYKMLRFLDDLYKRKLIAKREKGKNQLFWRTR